MHNVFNPSSPSNSKILDW